MQKAPVCYSCIEHAEIILVCGMTGRIAKLRLMTEWQSSPVRAFNMILWRIIFLLPMRLKEAQGRGSLGFICFVFNWFLEIKAWVKVAAWKPWIQRAAVFLSTAAHCQPVWVLTWCCWDGVGSIERRSYTSRPLQTHVCAQTAFLLF